MDDTRIKARLRADISRLQRQLAEIERGPSRADRRLGKPQDSENREPHYLQRELYERVASDPEIFDFLQEGSLDGVWYWDLEHPEHEWMSPKFWRVLGHDPDEKRHLASEWQDLINPEDLEAATRNLNAHCVDPEHPYDQTVRYLHKNGSLIWIRCRGIANRDATGRPVRMLGAHNELTAVKRAQADVRRGEAKLVRTNQQLQRAERLAAIGTFAAGVAHQINNPVGGILLAAQFALAPNRDVDSVRRSLNDIVSDSKRCGRIIRSVLRFASESESEKAPTDLNEIVRNVAATIRASGSARSAALDVEVAADLPLVSVNAVAVFEGIETLVRNSIESGSTSVVVSTRTTDEQVLVSVKDNGCGITREDRERVFDPFFTTRQSEGGTGLGLSILYAIIQDHNGSIDVVSEDSQGTTIILNFPRPKGRKISPPVKVSGPGLEK
jgi:PAS domain S-box-containing protein